MQDCGYELPRRPLTGNRVNRAAPCPLVPVASSFGPSLLNRDNVLNRRSTNVLYLSFSNQGNLQLVVIQLGVVQKKGGDHEAHHFGTCGNGSNGGVIGG